MKFKDGEPDITRAQVEKAIWEMTGWQGDATAVDGLLIVIDAYAAKPIPGEHREDWYHALVQMAEQILDTGGKMRLVPPESETVLRAGDIPALAEALTERMPKPDRRTFGEKQEDQDMLSCKTCGLKPASEFYKDAKSSTGHKGECKQCEKDRKAARAA